MTDLFTLAAAAKLSGSGGGEPPTLIGKEIAANGVYTASDDGADGYGKVTANVPNSYAAGDEGKVVRNGALAPQTTADITANGVVDTTDIREVNVRVANTRQIAEALEADADVQQSYVPALTVYKNDEYAAYIRIDIYRQAILFVAAGGFSNGLKNILSVLRVRETSGNYEYGRIGDNSVYPVRTANLNYFDIVPPFGGYHLKCNTAVTGIHPAISARYPGISQGNWVDFESSDESVYALSDLITLTGASSDDYVVAVINSSGKYVLVYSGQEPPVFEETSAGIYRAAGGQINKVYNVSSYIPAELKQMISVSYNTEQSAYYASKIVNTTFDMYDTNGDLIFAGNADISDFVKEA